MRRPAPPGRPVVVKVGSSSLTAPTGGIDTDRVVAIVEQIATLWASGHPAVLVSSGAVAAGLPALDLDRRPSELPDLQVAAAVGQGKLMETYSREFGKLGRVAGQVLLTRDVLANRSQYLHAGQALERMIALDVVPIVNENDTVVVDELRLGDNDRLAAIVSHLISAGMLIILSDTPGLFSGDPRMTDQAELLSAVRHTDAVLDELHRTTAPSTFGSGGVATKISAARMAAWSGIPTVVADSGRHDAAITAASGGEVGTWVEPHESRLTARKLWIAFGLRTEGVVEVDAGAARAIERSGASLLAAGVTAQRGSFAPGAAVEVVVNQQVIAKGMTRIGADQLATLRGAHTSVAGGAVIHRDDLVVFGLIPVDRHDRPQASR